MKRWKIIVLAVSVCAIPVAFATWSFSLGADTYGPLQCNACWVQVPTPDVATRAFLKSYVDANSYQAYGRPFYKQNPGDELIICNGEACTTYKMTQSRDWHGIKREPIRGSRPAGGGGSGVGRGGGVHAKPIGGGSFSGGGGRTGTVTVGGPTPERPSRPNQDN